MPSGIGKQPKTMAPRQEIAGEPQQQLLMAKSAVAEKGRAAWGEVGARLTHSCSCDSLVERAFSVGTHAAKCDLNRILTRVLSGVSEPLHTSESSTVRGYSDLEGEGGALEFDCP